MKRAFDQALTKAVKDSTFAQALKENPEEALQSYDLTTDEIAQLKSLTPQLFKTLRQSTFSSTQAWFRPANFREAGAAVLSLGLVGLLLYAAIVTFTQVNTTPISYTVGGAAFVVDPYDRAKDLLEIIFPLFGALVTFWLGVTVEGRRADRNEADAEEAKAGKAAAEQDATEVKETASTALDNVELVLQQMPMGSYGSALEGTGGAFESTSAAAPSINPAEIQSALESIQEARRKLSS